MPSAGTIGTEKVGIAHLLKNTNLVVPQYQRSYAWEERNVIDLLDDLERAVKGEAAEYFLGSVVLAHAEDPRGLPEVVDGQQRLATTTILIAQIRDHFARANDVRHQDIDGHFLMNRDLRSQEDVQKLRLNERDNDFFLRSVLRPTPDGTPVPQRDSHRAIQAASELCAGRVRKLVEASGSTDILIDFIEYLRDRAKVIALTVPSDENAFVLFETLNDRGLDLALSDLLKNYLFRIGGNRLAEVRAAWVSMYSLFEATNNEGVVVDFIRQTYSSRHGLTREKELFAALKKEVTGKQNAVEFAEDLRRSAVLFQALLSPTHPLWVQYAASAAKHVETLSFLGLTRIRPLLMAILEQFAKKDVETALRRAVSWAVRLTVLGGLGSGTIEEAFCQRAKEIRAKSIREAEALSRTMEAVVPSDTVFTDAMRSYSVTKSKLARYLLRSLERGRRAEPEPELVVNADPGEVNLEHVLPQNPGSNWPGVSAEEAAAFAYRLGNQVLLRRSENSSLGNGDFGHKRPVLAASSLLLTKEVAQAEAWTGTEIKARQEELAVLAAKVWPLR
ncbi:MAG TPA: DUF262 domain-containing HNH endonuclease family protein [Humisphaera sp.]